MDDAYLVDTLEEMEKGKVGRGRKQYDEILNYIKVDKRYEKMDRTAEGRRMWRTDMPRPAVHRIDCVLVLLMRR